MLYINVNDVKASIATGFNLQTYIDEANDAVDDLAEEHGLYDKTLLKQPLPWRVKRYAVVYALMRLCQDKIGSNNLDSIESEKYAVLYGVYRKELQEIRGDISYEMLTGTVAKVRDRSINSNVIFRS